MGGWGQSHAPDVVVDGDLGREDIIVVLDASFLEPSHVWNGGGRDILSAATMNIVGNTGSWVGDVVSHGPVGIGNLGPSELVLWDDNGLAVFFQDLINRNDFVVFILCDIRTIAKGLNEISLVVSASCYEIP